MILTSGTLAVGEDFRRFKEATGLLTDSRVRESVSPSPFTYSRNCLMYVSRLPAHQGAGQYYDSLTAEIAALLDAAHGHALVLFPIVHTLEERRYLRQDDGTGRYTMGPRALVLGAAFSADRGLAPITQVMKEVASKCQETCQMGILDQDRVLYVAREDSPQPIRLISWVGTRLPANATAVGKALLSGLTNEEVRALYAGGLPRLTEQTITDVETLLAQLEAVRRGELAMEREESTDQLACWAAPLRRKGTVFAALSISVPLFRCREEKIELVRRSLLTAQAEIEKLAETRNFGLSEN